MAEPTAADIAGFQTIGDIAAWAGAWAPERDLLLVGLGCVEADNFRPIGARSALDFEAVVGALQVAGQPPSPFVLSAWRRIGRAARLAIGTDQTCAQLDAAAAVRVQAAAAGASPPQLPVQARTGITRLNVTVDQGLDGELPNVGENEVEQMYITYTNRMGKAPAEDREPSIEQITAIQYLLTQSAPPYVDFSVFGPHSLRMRKNEARWVPSGDRRQFTKV